ncbi:glycosyltransferase involved in cell wall biosynthesis [Natronocella acetinitrilica]|uniref:Glycosyltransferase involved in cell wall biosynthesis n=1 Tax=Natronocella acetinitrilica TaxID=414046 RepID=A0AAE3KB50_9GAMM|nr:glycosyltransferase [Natronocella acetinitrilica]MCP1673173.1 glycosyltransferase involved in cell wall biosynthesis [Natronocella acetinitrilica]
MSGPQRLAVLVAFTGDGGVERMICNLLQGFVDQGIAVDLLLLKARGRHVDAIPSGVRIVRLDVRTSLFALPAVMAYLRRERPAALLAAKDRAGRVALIARRLTGVDTRVYLRMGMHLSGSLAGKSALRRWSRFLPVRRLYPLADGIITVADAVAVDLARIGGLPAERFHVIRNPSVTGSLAESAEMPSGHPWLDEEQSMPVLLGAGRLRPQKDFTTLLHAFAALRAQRPCRLIILGEGPDRETLQQLASSLGVTDDVDLPGFTDNPYAWMARSRVFVLSSRYEGAPNVLVEALSLGVPVVATDCPSGPAEILDDGRVAPLVPVGDVAAMTAAMRRMLDDPPPPDQLRYAVREYTVAFSSRRYLEAMGFAVDWTDHNQCDQAPC